MSGGASSSCASSSVAATCSSSTSRPTTSTPTPAPGCSSSCASYRGALLVVSHDLDLLDEAITRVVHIDRESEEGTGTLVEYKGTYSQYLAARDRDEERQTAKSRPGRRKEIARLKVQRRRDAGPDGQAGTSGAQEPRRQRSPGSKPSASCGTRAKRRALAVRFPEPPTAGRTVLTATELWKSFGPLDVFADVSFDVGRGERLLVMGLNGAGKTTLLKVLAGRARRPTSATVELGLHVSVGLLRAGARRDRRRAAPCSSTCARRRPAGDGALRNLLGMFGLSGDKVFQDAATLSGGEKTKLALAQLVAGRHNVLLLDEPTNNLDPASRTATGEALAAWPGTMIVVSHDDGVRAVARARPRAADARRHARLLRRRDARPASSWPEFPVPPDRVAAAGDRQRRRPGVRLHRRRPRVPDVRRGRGGRRATPTRASWASRRSAASSRRASPCSSRR